MSVLDSGSKGRERVWVGLQLGAISAESVKSVFRLTLGAPGCQVQSAARLERKSPQPLFVVLSRPEGCARVVVDT